MARIQRVSLERKRELEKPDRILVFLQTIGDYIRLYRRQVLMASGLIVLVVAGLAAGKYFSEKSAQAAFGGLARIESGTAAVSPGEALPAGQRQRYRSFYNENSGTLAGRIAGLRYADACLEAGDPDAAIEAYRQSAEDFKRQPLFRHLALSGLGYAYEAAGQYDEAARFFQKIADDPGAVDRDMAMFNLGRMYDRMGQTEKSRDVFARVAAEYPGSIYAPLAQAQISSWSDHSSGEIF